MLRAGAAICGARGARRRIARAPAIVFYAEDAASWAHLGPLVEELIAGGESVVYLTSDRNDSRLERDGVLARRGLEAFYIGSGWSRTSLFIRMPACTCVMTMPDLETFHLKRSRAASVHYVSVFHSLVSTHMIYRPAAFDHFDTVLCAGPHHVAEIRAREKHFGLPAKELPLHGYGRLDQLIEANREVRRSPDGFPEVVIAPSWGPHGLLETCGAELISALAAHDLSVSVRPHPMTVKRHARLLRDLEEEFGEVCRFQTDVAESTSLLGADVLISDWSGAALEYAFATERPVLFVDVPRKVNNPEYQGLGLEPVEVSLREELGRVLAADRIIDAGMATQALLREGAEYREKICAARERTVSHLGESARVGAEIIRTLGRGKPVSVETAPIGS